MNSTISHDLLLGMAIILFLLGTFATILGVTILVTRATGRDVRSLATQSARLAQKGVAEDVAGLVGNASLLLEAVNQLIRTTAGIGIFLTLLGLVLMGSACLLALQVA